MPQQSSTNAQAVGVEGLFVIFSFGWCEFGAKLQWHGFLRGYGSCRHGRRVDEVGGE